MRTRKHYLFAARLLILAMLLCSCGPPDGGIFQGRLGTGTHLSSEPAQQETGESGEEVFVGDFYILTGLDAGARQAGFRKASDGRRFTYSYDVGTKFLDKYGGSKSVQAFLPGDIVEITVKESGRLLESVQMSDQIWVYDNIVNYGIDEGRRAFSIGPKKYFYGTQMEIFSGEETVGFEQIGSADVLRACGIGKELLSLSIVRGHGSLALANTKLFEGSFICVGDRIFEEVAPDMTIEAPEGSYLVTVANNGYGGSKEVVIERNKTAVLDLDELKGEGPKMCEVTFDVGVEGAKLSIDGQQADLSAPVSLTYGVHTVTVEAEGYEPITKKLVANSEKAEIEIALTEEGSGKTDSTAGNTTGSAADGTTGNTTGNTTGGTTGNTTDNTTGGTAGNTAGSAAGGTAGNTAGSAAGGTAGNTAGGITDNTAQNDYLTTLYNLLTSINNANQNNTRQTTDSYDDLKDE